LVAKVVAKGRAVHSAAFFFFAPGQRPGPLQQRDAFNLEGVAAVVLCMLVMQR